MRQQRKQDFRGPAPTNYVGFGLGAVVRVSLRGAGLFRSAGAAAGGLRGTTEAGSWGVRALGRNPGLPFAVWPWASHLVEFSFLKMVLLTLLVPHLCPLTLTSVHSITWTRHLCRCPRQGCRAECWCILGVALSHGVDKEGAGGQGSQPRGWGSDSQSPQGDGASFVHEALLSAASPDSPPHTRAD